MATTKVTELDVRTPINGVITEVKRGKQGQIVRVVDRIKNDAPDAFFPGGGFLPSGNTGITDANYAGTWSEFFILPALGAMDSVNKGLFYTKDKIRKEYSIGSMDFSNPWNPRSKNPTLSAFAGLINNGGPINVTRRQLVPQDMMLYVEFDPRDLEETAWSEKLSDELVARQLPAEYEAYVVFLVLKRAFEQLENALWVASQAFQPVVGGSTYGGTGNPNYAGAIEIEGISYFPWQIQYFDGILTKILGNGLTQLVDNTFANATAITALDQPVQPVYVTNDPAFYQVPNGVLPAAVALTPSNIGDALENLYQNAATYNRAMLADASRYNRLKFICSIETAVIYEQFLTTQLFKNNDTTEAGINKYKGYDVVPVFGMPNNTIVFTEAISDTTGNLFFGVNSEADETIQLERTMAASETFFMKMLLKCDVNYGRGDKTYIYTTIPTYAVAGSASPLAPKVVV